VGHGAGRCSNWSFVGVAAEEATGVAVAEQDGKNKGFRSDVKLIRLGQ
jgi:hypothetical protein